MSFKVLGIDPGKTHMALCMLSEQEIKTFTIAPIKHSEKIYELIELEAWIDMIFDRHKPEVMFHEGISFAEKFGVAESGMIQYIIQRTSVNHNVPFYVLQPMTVRKFLKITGKSKGKTDITMAVYKKWGFENEDQNQVDAFAIAQCGLAVMQGEFELPKKKK